MDKNAKISGNFTQIHNSVIRTPKLTPYDKTIYMLIKSFDPSFPSYETIMKITGIRSRTTLSGSFERLEKYKLVLRNRSNERRSNLYKFPNNNLVDSDSPCNEQKSVQYMDYNNTNLTRPTNNTKDPATVQTVEGSERERIFAEAESSLGPDAGNGFKLKERPTFIIEA